MNKSIVVLLIAMSLSGCASRSANPIPIAQIGDDTKSCRAILNEMQEMKNSKLIAEGDRNGQVGKNVALGITGALLIVPWFFMDTGNAASVELKAAEARYRRLLAMAEDKNCEGVGALH